MITKSVVMPWVRVALNILLMFVIVIVITVIAAFLTMFLIGFITQILILFVAWYLVPGSFIALIWIRKRMIGEPPTDSMSIHAKVCMALIAAIMVSSALWGVAMTDGTEPDQDLVDLSAQTQLENAIRSTPITAEQKYAVDMKYSVCIWEGGGYDLITKEDSDACIQAYRDRTYEFQLENYYANQTAGDKVPTP